MYSFYLSSLLLVEYRDGGMEMVRSWNVNGKEKWEKVGQS